MRGRYPSGPEYVKHLSGSKQAKERLKTILETLAGTCRVQEACDRLKISEPRFHQLRVRILEAALGELEPRTRGRPAKTVSFAEEEMARLRAELAGKEMELQAALLREELFLVLPNAQQNTARSQDKSACAAGAPEEKKTPQR